MPGQPAAAFPGHRITVRPIGRCCGCPRDAATFGVLLRHPASGWYRLARSADHRAAGRPGRTGAGSAPRGPADHVRSNGRGQLPGCDAGRRPRGGDGQGTGRSLPCGSPRSGLAEGQAGAHTRLGGARGGMGLGTPARQALQYSPGRTRSGYRWIRDGGQDLQRNDRRHAGLADHQVSRDRGGSDRRLRRPT
ncbi:Uncharacterised protein [Mycobacterium tuberculosis]|uniref:Uncharacterized protein n=1 Tax=Mycobacterium tuberculosis TaxID=1773 RepID=A0A655FQ11_MYCTX|nr:Uncharacterised protein [Mycobacterium tuberculosis]